MRLRMILSALTAIAVNGAAPAAPPVSAPGRYSGYAAELFDGWVRSSRYVAVRDGAQLAVTLYRPAQGGVATSERLPVLFTFTPYLSRRLADGKVAGSLEQSSRGARPFAELTRYGYAVAVADVRGKGSSFGVRSGYADLHEGEDGADIVEWLAAQPWADGKLGMFGCSYVGGTQWATARNLPPHLKAIFPQAGQFDAYCNVRRSGIAGQFNTRPQSTAEDLPTAPVDGDDGTLRRAALVQHERDTQMSALVATLPYRDDRSAADDVQYWSLSSPYPRIDAIRAAGIAVYAWGNWMDELADQAMLGFANARGGPAMAKLIMGPGGHCDLDSVDAFAEHLRFFDHVLKNVDNGIDREPPVWFKTIGLPEQSAWRFADRLPLTGDAPRRLYLAPDAALTATRPVAAAPDTFQVRYDIGCAPPAWAMPRPTASDKPRTDPNALPEPGLWACVDSTKAKTYSTVPMSADMWLSGFPIVRLTLASTGGDALLFGYLEDVAPDGSATVIGQGRLQASQRKLGTAPYANFDLPWHSFARSDAAPLVPGKPTELAFELSPTSRVIAAGHLLRLSITGADQRQRNLREVAVRPAPLLTFTTGGRAASSLDLTLLPLARLPAERSAPGSR